MPLKTIIPIEYSDGGTPLNRGLLRRMNPIIFLTIFCTLFIFLIIAAMIVFTFLPIFTTIKGNQTRYQVQSSVLILTYHLPGQLPMLPMNWTYKTEDLDVDRLYVLQNLLQNQLNKKKLTRKTSIAVIEASISSPNASSISSMKNSSVPLNYINDTFIVITQPDSNTKSDSTPYLTISLMLRYALECAKRCQKHTKESIFLSSFHSLEIDIETFQVLFIEDETSAARKQLSSSSLANTESTTLMPCIVNTNSTNFTSFIITAVSYEAESSSNKLISATIEPCASCSGQKKVDNIGYNNELIFEQILSDNGGATIVNVHYTTDGVRYAEIMVNNLYPSITVKFPMLPYNQETASLPILLSLCQGFNTIRIYNPDDVAPAIDRIVVY